MTNNVNVINNAGNNVDVKVNEVNGAIQIVIDVPSSGVELSTLEPGTVFKKNGVEYIVCEQHDDRRTSVVRKECLENSMKFGDNNNWIGSDVRSYLNESYLSDIENDFGEDNILVHDVDLTSLDGYNDYGVSKDKVSLMTIDRYRKYHKYIDDTGEWNWLSTPDSTPSGISSSSVLYVNGDGSVCWSDCNCYSEGVRPFFILKSSISVSLD